MKRLDLEDKLQQVSGLDARIARARRAEREALIRGGLLGLAMYAILGEWSPGVETALSELIRYGGTGFIVGFEYVIRRFQRRGLEVKQRRLLEQPPA